MERQEPATDTVPKNHTFHIHSEVECFSPHGFVSCQAPAAPLSQHLLCLHVLHRGNIPPSFHSMRTFIFWGYLAQFCLSFPYPILSLLDPLCLLLSYSLWVLIACFFLAAWASSGDALGPLSHVSPQSQVCLSSDGFRTEMYS